MQAPFFCRPAGVDFFAQRMEPVDVSLGGLRIQSDEEYPLGAVVRLEVLFPRRAPVTFTGEVMWVKAASRDVSARYDVGLAFIQLSQDALNTLRPLLGAEGAARPAPASNPHVRAPLNGPEEPIDNEPVSEIRLVTAEPATVRFAQGAASLRSRIPVIVVDAETLRASQLDMRAGFLLSRIDGVTNVRGLLDLSAMPVEETLAILAYLEKLGVVELRPPA